MSIPVLPDEHTQPQQTREVELSLTGMTCASCANRIERKLKKLPGVDATVNYATEKAHVIAPSDLTEGDLVATVEKAGYGAAVIEPVVSPAAGATSLDAPADADGHALSSAADDHVAQLRQRLLICAVLTLPVIAMAMIPALQFTNWQWLSLTLAAPVAVWGAWPFHRAAWTNLRHGATTMDTLVSVGVIAAFGWSLYALFFGHAGMPGMKHGFDFGGRSAGGGNIYLEAAAGVTTFILLGRYIEVKSKRASGAALRALLDLGAKDVAVLRAGADGVTREVRIPVHQLAVGEKFVVRPGEKVATDGIVEDGASAIDAAMLTGESVPVDVGVGDAVVGATLNAGGRLIVRATKVGADTQLARMAKLVEDAQTGKAQVQRLADRISGIFVPIVIAIALVTLVGWLIVSGDVEQAFTAAVAVLVIACPCALGLATPTALMVGTGRGAQLGILIKGPQVLETTRRIDTIVLDKTGTVTTGEMTVVSVTADEASDVEVLQVAGVLESGSEHPIAQAISQAAIAKGESGFELTHFENVPGLGARGRVRGHAAATELDVVVGRPHLLEQAGMPVSPRLTQALTEAQAQGATAVLVGWEGQARGVIAVADAIKPTSKEAITQLRALGLEPILLTGDNARVAEAVASQVGITRVISDVLPADKVATVERLRSEGKSVAMVGDGVNDAAALATADLGLAMGTGTDAAIEAADLTLVRGDLRVAADAIRLSRRTLATIKGNLFWAFAYNVAAIPLAALGYLNPMIAGAAMAFSSVFVVLNSLRLRGFTAESAGADSGTTGAMPDTTTGSRE